MNPGSLTCTTERTGKVLPLKQKTPSNYSGTLAPSSIDSTRLEKF